MKPDLTPQKIEAELRQLLRPKLKAKDDQGKKQIARAGDLKLRVKAKTSLPSRDLIRVSDKGYDYDIVYNPKKIRTQADYDDFMKTCRYQICFGDRQIQI